MSRPQSIIVVGGGIGGMTAAIALANAGFRVRLLEAAPQFGEIGAGVTLSPNAMKGLDYIGVCEAVASAGVEPTRQRIQHWQDGRVLVPVERGSARAKYGAPYVTIHRADLHAILVEAAKSAGVELQTGAMAERVTGGRVHLHNGQTVEGELVIGADGLKSVVRQLFEPVEAHFTGHVAWRSLVPVDDAIAEITAWPGVHIGPGRMVTRYPVRDGTLLNMVFFARQNGWTEDGWTIAASPEDLTATFDGWCNDVQVMIAAASKGPLFKWAINARKPLAGWTIDNNIVLIGDAAHAMTPFLGHGAACAIEDAIILARALDSSTTTAEGLRRFVAARHERASFIQAESNSNADRMQSANSHLFGIDKMRDEESLGLFEYDCRTVPL